MGLVKRKVAGLIPARDTNPRKVIRHKTAKSNRRSCPLSRLLVARELPKIALFIE